MGMVLINFSRLHNIRDLPQWLVALIFFGPLFLTIAYLIYIKSRESIWKKGTFPMKLPFTRSNYLDAHICLAAYFIQRDRAAIKEKIEFLTRYFQRFFSQEYYDFQESLKSSFNYPITPVSVAKWLKDKNVSTQEREQLLIFLIQFCGIDGLIIDKEYVLLKQVALTLGFEERQFQKLLQSQGPRKAEAASPPNSISIRKHFSEVLGLGPTASKSEIKQAYRRLVKIHHPDKFTSASEEQRQKNQAAFIAIQEAYDYLYQLKG
jgi:DnaJ like chaperone protein